MVTAPEAVALLAHASSHDNRKPDQATVRAWAEVLADVDFGDAMTAVTNHYTLTRDWIMPSDIIREVRRVEAERIAAGPNLDELEPPEYLMSMDDGPEFTAAYLAWYREQKRRLRRGLPLEVGAPVEVSANQYKQLVS